MDSYVKACRRALPCTLLMVLLCASAPSLLATEYSVTIDGDSFDPPMITVEIGDTIRWINDGGSNNVTERDGLFRSGDLSTDLWQYVYQFAKGGTYVVYSERDPSTIRATVTVTGVFADGFDYGHLGAWDGLVPERPDCFCYFSFDCVDGEMCDYGPGGFSTEDICSWVDGKPDGVPGAGCNLPHNGVWGGEICDGVCSPSRNGSIFGYENQGMIRQAVGLWTEAVLVPAEEGGGPLHETFLHELEQLDFTQPGAMEILGRQVADILILTGGMDLYHYFCHHEQYPENPKPSLWLDFSEQPCRVSLARLTIDSLLAGMDGGDVHTALEQMPSQCADWQTFIVEDCRGDDAVKCLGHRINDMAVYLTTPKAAVAPAVVTPGAAPAWATPGR
ncbi:MAG: hypothetical protein AAFX50_02820 [Acidobacteriota bacterium]